MNIMKKTFNCFFIFVLFFNSSLFAMESRELIIYGDEHQVDGLDVELWRGSFDLPFVYEVAAPGAPDCDSVHVSVLPDRLRIIEALLREAADVKNHARLFEKLQGERWTIGLLSELISDLSILNIKKDQPLIHLVAQALAKKYRLSGEFNPAYPENFIHLYEEWDHELPYIADSLKMYLYLNLPASERIILNSYLTTHLSVQNFVQQNPDIAFLQDDCNGLHQYRALIKMFHPLRYRELDGIDAHHIYKFLDRLSSDRYAPFWQELVARGIAPFKGRADTNQMAHDALMARDVVMMRYLIDKRHLDPNMCLKDGKDCREKPIHILLIATIFDDENMVRLLLEFGADPFARCNDDPCRHYLIQRVLNLYPGIEGDHVIKRICLMIIQKAKKGSPERLFSCMIDRGFRSKLLDIYPELADDYNQWRRNHSQGRPPARRHSPVIRSRVHRSTGNRLERHIPSHIERTEVHSVDGQLEPVVRTSVGIERPSQMADNPGIPIQPEVSSDSHVRTQRVPVATAHSHCCSIQ